jgi:UDP-N-acetyl-D-glucosamine dehydrogenase
MNDLMEKINTKQAVIGVVGLGYVGLPITVESANIGFKTIGFDVQQSKVDLINSSKNYIKDIDDRLFTECIKSKRLIATSDFLELRLCDIILICVPTPLDRHLQPDVQYIIKSAESIAKYRKKPSLIILESTTYPGTTEDIVKPILEKDGSILGKDLFLAFSPERVDPGNKTFKTKNIPKVVGGCTKVCSEIAKAFYSAILTGGVYIVSSPKVAEMEKLLENTFRLVNIGLVNEMAVLSDRLKIDIWEVIEAAKTKPYGFMPFYPGPGLGGHCIPIDPFYLSWKAKEFHFQTTLIEAAGQTNNEMPNYVVHKIGKILNDHKKSYSGSRILILGVAYKKDIDDYRESPSIRIIELLEELKATINVVDPYINEFYGFNDKLYKTELLTDSLLKDADLTVIVTDHSCFDEGQIINNAKLIYDTRNFIKSKLDKVIKL